MDSSSDSDGLEVLCDVKDEPQFQQTSELNLEEEIANEINTDQDWDDSLVTEEDISVSFNQLDLSDFVLEDLLDSSPKSGSEFSFIGDTEIETTEACVCEDEVASMNSDWSLLNDIQISYSDFDSGTDGSCEYESHESDYESSKATDHTVTLQSLQGVYSGRRLTKKQEKKKRKRDENLFKTLFSGLCDYDVDNDTDQSLSKNTTKLKSVLKEVPSLVDCCVQSIHRYKRGHLILNQVKEKEFPNRLKSLFLSSNLKHTFDKFRLSCACNVLTRIEQIILKKQTGVCTYYYASLASYCTQQNLQKKNMIPHMTNVWMKDDKPDSILIGHFADKSVSSFIQELYLVFSIVLDSTISSLSCKFDKQSWHLEIAKKGANSKHFNLLFHNLRSRFTHVTSCCFDWTLPYVLWARGDIKSALQTFLKLHKDLSYNYKQRIFVIGEIGRMFAMVDDTEKAGRTYRMMADCLIQCNSYYSQAITVQMMVMLANLYDQGLITDVRTKNAFQCWAAVCRDASGDQKKILCIKAANSALCFHSGTSNGECWWEEVLIELQRHVKSVPDIWYHIAFVSAMMGNRKYSDECYGHFVKSVKKSDEEDDDNKNIPGMALVSILTGRKVEHHSSDALQLATQSPFEPLLSVSQMAAPMSVMWRKQFHHINFANKDEYQEFDMCNRNLHLRVTEDEFVTGDCQMIYPPISSILLNAYTGQICFKTENKKANAWRNFPDFSLISEFEQKGMAHLSLPHVMEIYRHEDKDGFQVVQMTCNEFYYFSTENREYSFRTTYNNPYTEAAISVQWSNSSGERAKFNLVQKLKDVIYKDIKSQILESGYDEEMQNKMLKTLLKRYTKGHGMEYSEIMRASNQYVYKRNYGKYAPKPKKQTQHSMRKEESSWIQNSKKFYVDFLCSPFKVGRSVVLKVKVISLCYLVILDCRCRDNFVQPVIKSTDELSEIIWSPSSPDYFCSLKYSRHTNVFDEKGYVIYSCDEKNFKHMVASKILYKHSHRIWYIDMLRSKKLMCDEFLEVDEVEVMGPFVVMKNEYGIKFADARLESLKPMLIHQEKHIESKHAYKISENKEQINGKFQHFKVLGMNKDETIGGLALDNILMLFTTRSKDQNSTELIINHSIELPGFPVTLTMLDKTVGFLVTWTQHSVSAPGYTEHLFHYGYSGHLFGILPFLGKHNNCTSVHFLKGDENISVKYPGYGQKGWYVFIQDGQQGIMCVKLNIPSTSRPFPV